MNRLEGTEWTLVELEGKTLALGEAESPPLLVLTAETSRVSGSGGCNRLAGSFQLDGSSLRFGPVAVTRMACAEAVMEREAAFLEALAATSRYELEDESLALLDESGVIARFVTSATSTS